MGWRRVEGRVAYACTYYFKYNENSWLAKMGWRRVEGRVAVVEGDPEYPKLSERLQGADYASKGFNNMKLNL
ncbi:NADH:ubiquinone oxidoreductase, NDUFB6/B17 subunit [Popillia japonica]|uniref:NADH:ubiquinone oxidoreductase, NDUFB6/B17 subunit n=1 Tax=Popillia japonica TaxID=7064 RepID=A0AAW1IA23_POPJA